MRGARPGASIEGSDKVEYCSVPECVVPRDALAYRQSQPYMSVVSKYCVLRNGGKCRHGVDDNFSVEERGKECYAE